MSLKLNMNLLAMICFLLDISDCTMFRKFMTLNDPDNATLFTPLANPPSKIRKSLVECGAYAVYAMNQPNKATRASAFQYVNQLCTLGRTPMFDNQVQAKPTVSDGSAGTHGVVGVKPTAPTDMVAYFLLNELYNLAKPFTPGLTGVTQASSPGPWSLPLTSFTMTSPVQSLEGQFAAPAYPQVQYTHDPKIYTSMSVMMWYNSGSSTASSDPLFGVIGAGAGYLAVLLGGGSAGKMEFRHSVPCAQYQFHPTTNVVMPTGSWVYIGFTYQPGNVILYVNGTQKAQFALTTCGPNPGAINVTYIEIGNDGPQRLTGYLASIEVYDRFLNQSQVVDAMHRSTSRALLT